MTEEQEEYLQFLMTKTKIEAFWRDEGTLRRIYQLSYIDDEPGLCGELGKGHYVALYGVDLNDIVIYPDIAIWPVETGG